MTGLSQDSVILGGRLSLKILIILTNKLKDFLAGNHLLIYVTQLLLNNVMCACPIKRSLIRLKTEFTSKNN